MDEPEDDPEGLDEPPEESVLLPLELPPGSVAPPVDAPGWTP